MCSSPVKVFLLNFNASKRRTGKGVKRSTKNHAFPSNLCLTLGRFVGTLGIES